MVRRTTDAGGQQRRHRRGRSDDRRDPAGGLVLDTRGELWGPIHGCHVFTPILRAAGRGGIINVASAASFGAAPAMAAYNVSKAAVLSLSETLAAYDRGGLYCMPALDAKIGWGIKRVAPTTFTRTAGLVTRIGSAVSS